MADTTTGAATAAPARAAAAPRGPFAALDIDGKLVRRQMRGQFGARLAVHFPADEACIEFECDSRGRWAVRRGPSGVGGEFITLAGPLPAPQSTRVATQVWAPNPDKPGFLKLERTRTVKEVYDDLRAIVGEYPYGGEEYFSVCHGWGGREWPCPLEGRIAVFPVTGSNEGDYVHVEVLDGPRRHLVLLAKTFDGRDASWAFARRLADLLEA